jgi:hydroxymethylbilane synthase
VADALRGLGHEVELLEVVTTGDRWSASAAPEAPAPARGLFVKELEQALLDGRAHIAVHSAKDLPAGLPPGLGVVAVPAREDPRDVLVGCRAGLDGLREGARVGTGSPRRAAQLALARPDVAVVPVRGNVGTRLALLGRGVDALMLAAAGLNRLGIERDDVVHLTPEVSTPAPGQGLLAIEGVMGSPAAAALRSLDDAHAHSCLRAERRLLAALGGGCMQPVGALARADGPGSLTLTAFAGSEDGARSSRARRTGDIADPETLGDRVAAALAMVRP